MKTAYDKLVRDGIAARLDEAGVGYETRRAERDEMKELLTRKLHEEVEELGAATLPSDVKEEIVDILEVLYAIAARNGCNEQDLAELRTTKREERGAFSDGVVLLWTESR
jgi:predicted house-cleaning noncanonical NTP pyrophosphatase (MazG superfamily)